jgi:hypothetical protein
MDKLSTEDWRIGSIASYIDIASLENKLIEIPRFQRGIVWGKTKIERLVDSLFNSYPIGSLLAFDAGSEGKRRKYQLVDGLQRANAIAKFTGSPLLYASPENLFSSDTFKKITEALELDASDDFTAAKSMVESWLKKVKDTESEEFLYSDFKTHLCGDDQKAQDKLRYLDKELEKAIYKVRTKVQDVLNSRIPVLVYEGEEENIPEIFERINSQGTQLSKYDILASSWVRTSTHIKNPEILEAVKDKYRSWESEGFEVQEEILGEEEEMGNLYEYLMGLSKVISNSYPVLFGPEANSEDIAFQIFTVAHGLPVGRMKELPQEIGRDSSDIIDPAGVEAALFATCEAISKKLNAYVGIRGNKAIGEPKPAHSQNQILSIITSLMVSAYDLRTGKLTSREVQQRILQNMPAHYLLDILRRAWKGSGDSKLFDRTWLKDEKGKAIKPDTYYQVEITQKMFEMAFNQWNEEQMSKTQTTRPNLQKDVLLVLRFLYSGIITHLQDNSQVFEVEHIYPVSYCSRIISETHDDQGWPISAIGNLMLLPKPINRIKGEKLLGPEVERLGLKGELQVHEKQHIQDYLLAPVLAEIVADQVTNSRDYREFCASRSKVILEKLFQNMNLRNGTFDTA